MATTFKVLGQSNPAGNTATTLYTVPGGTSTVLSTLNVCNLAGAATTYRIAIRPAGATLANSHYLAYDGALPALDSIAISIGATLAATDVVTIYAATGNVAFTAFGSEVT